jgi:hypothetical protein
MSLVVIKDEKLPPIAVEPLTAGVWVLTAPDGYLFNGDSLTIQIEVETLAELASALTTVALVEYQDVCQWKLFKLGVLRPSEAETGGV